VTGDAPFSSFELQIAPDAAEVDRIYVGLSRAGDGYVVYGPALRAEGQDTRLQFSGAASDAALPTENAIAGYAFVGPANHIGGDEQAVERTLAHERRCAARKAIRARREILRFGMGFVMTWHPLAGASRAGPFGSNVRRFD
jgi:hypothetical protein